VIGTTLCQLGDLNCLFDITKPEMANHKESLTKMHMNVRQCKVIVTDFYGNYTYESFQYEDRDMHSVTRADS